MCCSLLEVCYEQKTKTNKQKKVACEVLQPCQSLNMPPYFCIVFLLPRTLPSFTQLIHILHDSVQEKRKKKEMKKTQFSRPLI